MQTCLVFLTLFAALCCTVHVNGKECIKNGKTHTRKEGWFITDDCRQKCRCSKGGKPQCRALCKKAPKGTPRCQAGETLTDEKRVKGKSKQCFCTVQRCVKQDKPAAVAKAVIEGCVGSDNISYTAGQNFISEDCRGYCKCEAGKITCNSLCPPRPLICASGEVEETYDQVIVGSHCTCPVKRCSNAEPSEFCLFPDGERYPLNKRFIPKDCRGSCKCRGKDKFSCVSLCPPNYIECGPGFQKESFQDPVGDSGCSCTRPRCKPIGPNPLPTVHRLG